MNFLKWAGCIAVLTLQFSFAVSAQEQSQALNSRQIPTLRFDTVQILEHARRLSDDARSLKPSDEIPLQARLADTVWERDQSLAERLLSRSFELTIALLKDSPRVDSASSPPDPQVLFADISSIAAKHDQKLEVKLRERWEEAVAVAEKAGELKPDPTQTASLLLRRSRSYLK